MKKHLLSLFALAGMVFATSCTQEEIVSQSTDNEVKVTFTTELRNDVKSRTVGEDTDNIDQLIFAVYDEQGKELPKLRQSTHMTEDGAEKAITLTSDGNKKKATITVTLVKGQTYSFAFWAQKKGFTAYTFNPATQEVSVNYADRTANQREADAFFKGITDHEVTGTFTMDVTLKRPFAQVNFLTSQDDIINARKAGFYEKESKILVKNVAKTLNVLTGEVKDFENTEVTFDFASLLKDDANALETTTIKGVDGEWKYLATAYFLPQQKSEETKINATMEIKAEDTNKAVTKIVATDITAQRNYRTNIYGNLLTSNGTFNVVVDPDFEDDDHNVESGVYDVTSTSLSALLTTNKDLEGDLVYNVSGLSDVPSVSVAIPEGTKASSLTFNFTDVKDNATMSIDDATGATTKYAGTVVIKNPVDKTIATLTVGLPEAHVILKQGNYTNVSSSTSSTTLVIANGASVGTLTVNEGHVRIEEGGNVKTIERGKANPDPVTYVIYEGEVPSESNTGSDIANVSSTEFDLTAAITKGGEVKLTMDVELKEPLVIASGIETIIDLNGYTLSAESTQNSGNFDMIKVIGSLTVKNGTVTTEHEGSNMGWSAMTTIFDVTAGGVLNLENVTAKNLGGSDMAFVAHLNNWGEVTLNVENSTLESTYIAVRVFNSGNDMNNVTIKNSTLKAKYCFWVHNYTLADFGNSQDKFDAHEALLNFDIFNGTNTFEYTGTAPALYGFTDAIYFDKDGNCLVKDSNTLVAALASGYGVVLQNDIKIDPANMSNAYGTTGINVKNGQSIDGGNHTLDIKGAGGTWDSGINTTGGLIKNITVTGSFRGIFINHNSTHSEKVVLENVTTDGTVYTISCDQGTNQGLEATDCTFKGWTSYAATLGDATFTNCTFGEGSGYAFCRPYAPTTFVGCEFEAGFEMDPRAAVTFENCKLGGVALTAENLATLVTSNIANATVK